MRQEDSRSGAGFGATRRGRLYGASALALALLLGACSSPDWVNPGSWFEDDPPQAETIIIPEDNSAIPNLATVPTLPPVPSPQIQRQQIAEGLAADRDNARYSDEPLTSATTAVPAADPPISNGPPPAPFEVATVPAEGGISSAPLAPPPPGSAAAESPSGAPNAAPSRAPAPSQPVGQPGLLQQQAYQQLFQQRQRTQQLALQNQAFEQEARQRAIEQQFLRQQAIEQQAVQRRALELQARQLAVVPVPQAPALQVAPQAFPNQAYTQGYAPQAAFAGGAAAAGYGVGAAGYAAAGQGQPPPSGNLIGVIYFQHGSTALDGNDQEVLRQVAGLAQQSGAGLQVVGHASARTGALDPVRHRMANFQVSMTRANRVAEALARLGSPRERIIVSAQSDGRPVYHEFMPTGEAGNRRVEIYLQY